MERTTRRAVGIAIAVAALLPTVSAGAEEPGIDPDLAAETDTWPVQDGSAGRTRATRGRFLEDAQTAAWTYEAPGRIHGDPVVWDDRVVVLSGSPGSWSFDVLRLRDGKAAVPRRNLAGQDAQVGVWRDLVCASTDGVLEVFRVATAFSSLVSVEKVPAPGWTLRGGQLLVAAGTRVELPDVDWEVEGTPLGPPSFGGGLAHVVTARPLGGNRIGHQYRLESYDLGSSVGRGRDMGWAVGPRYAEVVTNGRMAIVRVDPGTPLQGGGDGTHYRVPLVPHLGMTPEIMEVHGHPIAWGQRLLVWATFDAKNALAAAPSDVDQLARGMFEVLADPENHPQFLPISEATTIASGVVRQPGAGLWEIETGRVLGPDPWPAASVVIPARETMLAVENDRRRLVAYRRAAARRPEGPVLAVPEGQAGTTVPGALVATLDGATHSASPAFSAKTGRVTGIGKTAVPLADVGLVLDRQGRLVHGPDADFVARALPRVVAQGRRDAWVALAKRAVQSGDAATARRVIEDFGAHGGRTDEALLLWRAQRRLAGAADKPAIVEEVARRRAALLAQEAAGAWAAFESIPESVPIAYRATVLRAVLAMDPAREEAVAWLRARLPSGVVPAAAREPLEWLEVVEVATQTSLRSVPEPAAKVEDLTPDSRALAAARARWRKDLVGLRTDRLLLVTPVSRPGRIARCLALGELACAELDRLFGVEAAAKELEPLEVHLFESRDEYVAASPDDDGGHGESGRPWAALTLGHYRPTEGVSFLFVPEGDDAFERVAPVLVHELTHHWLDRRMPSKPGVVRRKASFHAPGFFLEEGIATLVEEARIDVRERTVSFEVPRADSLDTVSGAPRLLPWEQVLTMPQAEFRGLADEPAVEVPHRWVLGRRRRLSETNLFYAQSAAACHWMLRADGGKRKEVLLDWIRDLHAGATGPDDVARRLGTSPADAGKAILAWCREEVLR
jgi:hypothetical protein